MEKYLNNIISEFGYCGNLFTVTENNNKLALYKLDESVYEFELLSEFTWDDIDGEDLREFIIERFDIFYDFDEV